MTARGDTATGVEGGGGVRQMEERGRRGSGNTLFMSSQWWKQATRNEGTSVVWPNHIHMRQNAEDRSSSWKRPTDHNEDDGDEEE